MTDAHCLALLVLAHMRPDPNFQTPSEPMAREWALDTLAWAKAQDAELARRVDALTAPTREGA